MRNLHFICLKIIHEERIFNNIFFAVYFIKNSQTYANAKTITLYRENFFELQAKFS